MAAAPRVVPLPLLEEGGMTASSYERFTEALRLHGCKKQGPNWSCPAHDDRNPSLSVSTKDGKVLLTCHTGCSNEDVVRALGMEMRDLFDDEGKPSSSEDAVYRYTDEAGTPLFEVVRFYPKDFRQRLPNGTWSLDGVRRVPYRLPELVRAIREDQPVYVVEGEKDVHAIERAGGVATTNPGGAGKWRSEFSAYFTGATVIVVADKDEAGRKHAQHVKASLGQVASVLVVEPKSGKDAADHLAAGFALDDWAAFEATPTVTTSAPPRNGWRKGSEREPKSLEFAWRTESSCTASISRQSVRRASAKDCSRRALRRRSPGASSLASPNAWESR
jgi:5S rRNA maturation endonuclease (ribonuclease M5)